MWEKGQAEELQADTGNEPQSLPGAPAQPADNCLLTDCPSTLSFMAPEKAPRWFSDIPGQ